MKADVRLEHTLITVDHDQRLHAMLELTGPARTSLRPPMALALVLDRSGSMSGAKLEAARSCAVWLAQRLRPDDRLALISFDDQVVVETPLTAVADGRFEAAVRRLESGGSTNLSGGWLKGRELLRAAGDLATRRILLLTDGQANVGIIDSLALAALTECAAAEGIVTTTIGFGDGFDEDLLTAMATAGRGAAHYAASPDDAPAVFATEVEDLADLTAQNVSVTITRVHPGVRGVEVLGGWRATADVDRVVIDVGDLYAGRTRRLVFALDVGRLQSLGPVLLAELSISATTVGRQIATRTTTLPVTAHVASAADAEAAGIDLQVREQVEVLLAADAQRRAIRAYDSGDVAAGNAFMSRATEHLLAAPASAESREELREEALMLQQMAVDASAGGLHNRLRKRLHYNAARRERGR